MVTARSPFCDYSSFVRVCGRVVVGDTVDWIRLFMSRLYLIDFSFFRNGSGPVNTANTSGSPLITAGPLYHFPHPNLPVSTSMGFESLFLSYLLCALALQYVIIYKVVSPGCEPKMSPCIRKTWFQDTKVRRKRDQKHFKQTWLFKIIQTQYTSTSPRGITFQSILGAFREFLPKTSISELHHKYISTWKRSIRSVFRLRRCHDPQRAKHWRCPLVQTFAHGHFIYVCDIFMCLKFGPLSDYIAHTKMIRIFNFGGSSDKTANYIYRMNVHVILRKAPKCFWRLFWSAIFSNSPPIFKNARIFCHFSNCNLEIDGFCEDATLVTAWLVYAALLCWCLRKGDICI